MGYSLSVLLKNEKQKKELSRWLEDNYKPFSQVQNKFPGDYSAFQDKPSYAPDRYLNRLVGMDFNCSDPERNYIHAIIRLLAIHVGVKTKDLLRGEFKASWLEGHKDEWPEQEVPFFFYDSSKITIFQNEIWREFAHKYAPVQKGAFSGAIISGPDNWLTKENGLLVKGHRITPDPEDPFVQESLRSSCKRQDISKELKYLRDEVNVFNEIYKSLETELNLFREKLIKDFKK